MGVKTGTEKALSMLKKLPRISLSNLRPNPGANIAPTRGRGIYGGKTHGTRSKGSGHRQNFMPVGYETGNNPFYLRFPIQKYYQGHHLKLSYVPITLQKLQLMVDTNRIQTELPIDFAQIMLTGLFLVQHNAREGGFMLEHEGADCFKAQINIEVQWASEPVIAAIERNGGIITTAYYDLFSVFAACDPESFFRSGRPIPRRLLPPQNLIEYYSNPKNRGYLADPDQVLEEKFKLSQKYGYTLKDWSTDPKLQLWHQRKDPRQVFFGLNPGWVVNLKDKVILKNQDPELCAYYNS